MSNKPQPVTQSFLLCEALIEDRHSPTKMIVSPFRNINLPAFPAVFPLCLFTQLTGGHGMYRLSVQLHNASGEVLGEIQGPRAENMTDPLAYYAVCWRNVRFKIPEPSRYSVVLLADNEEIGRPALDVTLALKG